LGQPSIKTNKHTYVHWKENSERHKPLSARNISAKIAVNGIRSHARTHENEWGFEPMKRIVPENKAKRNL